MKIKKEAAPFSPYEPDFLERLRDPEYAAGYLAACIDPDGDPDEEVDVFFAAVENIVKARGVGTMAKEMDMSRDAIYKIFEHRNPKIKTLWKMLGVLQLAISTTPRPAPRKRTAEENMLREIFGKVPTKKKAAPRKRTSLKGKNAQVRHSGRNAS